jgi:hypothetical protein
MLALATRRHFKEHRFVVRFQPVVIQMFELCCAVCAHMQIHNTVEGDQLPQNVDTEDELIMSV